MKYLHSLLPGYTPPHIAQQGDLIILRERILQTILIYLSGFGIFTYIVAMRDALIERSLINGLAFTIIFAATLLVTALRNMPYRVRSVTLLSVVFGAGIFSLVQYGLGGNARIFLYTFAALTAVMLGARASIAGLVGSLVLLIVFAVGMSAGWIPAPPLGANADPRNISDWILAIAYFILLVLTSTMSLVAIIRGMESSLNKQSELAHDLEAERASLEERISEHTQDLERRLIQIRTAVDITRSLSTMLDPQVLLQSVVDLVQERMGLYYNGVFLVDNANEYAVLQAGSGEPGRKMVAAGHRLQIGGSSMIGWTIINRQARIALDVGSEAIRFSNPNLPLTRSELALPLEAADRVIGAITIQSDRPNAFDENDILIFQGIADSLAVAVQNARLFQQTQQDLDEIRSLNRQYLQQAWTELTNVYGSLQYTFDNPLPQGAASADNKLLFPITLRDQVIGNIEIESSSSSLAPEDQAIVEAITTQTALALESARLLDETQRRATQEEKINDLSAQFSRAINIDDILQIALKELGQIPSVAEVSVHLLPPLESAEGSPSGAEGTNGNGRGKEQVL